jgi:hypothetical protein
MKKQVRLGFLALALTATFGLSSLADRDAAAIPCRSTCDLYFENCLSGDFNPECQGDTWCCLNVTSFCYNHSSPDC